MRISTYKVPIKLTRSANGVVSTQLIEDQKAFLKSEELKIEPSFIPSKAMECSEHNSKQIEVAKVTLLKSESEIESFVEFKYLE